MIFQNLHENLNQKVDSISERVPKLDFEGPGPQNPRKIAKFSKTLLKILYIYVYAHIMYYIHPRA